MKATAIMKKGYAKSRIRLVYARLKVSYCDDIGRVGEELLFSTVLPPSARCLMLGRQGVEASKPWSKVRLKPMLNALTHRLLAHCIITVKLKNEIISHFHKQNIHTCEMPRSFS